MLPKSSDFESVLVRERRERFDSDTGCEDGRRDWSDESTEKKPQRLVEERHGSKRYEMDSPSEAPKGTNLTNILIWDFWPRIVME